MTASVHAAFRAECKSAPLETSSLAPRALAIRTNGASDRSRPVRRSSYVALGSLAHCVTLALMFACIGLDEVASNNDGGVKGEKIISTSTLRTTVMDQWCCAQRIRVRLLCVYLGR